MDARPSADLDAVRDDAARTAFHARRESPLPDGATPVNPPPGDRPRIDRVSADMALAAHRPEAGPVELATVLGFDHVRRTAAAIDQVTHRSDRALAERGFVGLDVHKINEDEFCTVERLREEIQAAAAVIDHMLRMTRERLAAAPSRPPTAENDPMDPKQYHKEASGRGPTSPADAPPDSPHGGLGKGKQEAIENVLAGETGADGIIDHAVTESTETTKTETTKAAHAPKPAKADKDDDKDKDKDAHPKKK